MADAPARGAQEPRKLWPRGHYNGERIGGVVVKIEFNIWRWYFGIGTRWSRALFIGPLHMWFSLAYEAR